MKHPIAFKVVAERFGWSEGKLCALVDRSHFPSPFKIGSKKYFTEEIINSFFEQKEEEALSSTHAKASPRPKRARIIRESRVRDLLREEVDRWERENLHNAKDERSQNRHQTDGSRVIQFPVQGNERREAHK